MKSLLALLFLGGLALAAALVPLRGRTVLARWQSAPSAGAFIARAMEEASAAHHGRPSSVPTMQRPARGAAPAAAGAAEPGNHPAEGYTEDDRAELDRIVAKAAR